MSKNAPDARKKSDKNTTAALKFVQKIGSYEKAKDALEQLKKLQKAA